MLSVGSEARHLSSSKNIHLKNQLPAVLVMFITDNSPQTRVLPSCAIGALLRLRQGREFLDRALKRTDAVRAYDYSIQLAPQSAFARTASAPSQAADAGP